MTKREWEKYFKNSKNFIEDGIINEEKFYDVDNTKVLYLMWEPNLKNHIEYSDMSFRQVWSYANTKKLYDFAYRIAEWTAYIKNTTLTYIEIRDLVVQDPFQFLERVAIVNVKKTAGGGTIDNANFNTILQNTDYLNALQEQIKSIAPDYVIAGFKSKFKDLKSILNMLSDEDWDENTYLMNFHNGSKLKFKVLNFFHPSQRNAIQPFHALFRSCWEELLVENKTNGKKLYY